jgi:spermidine synthase
VALQFHPDRIDGQPLRIGVIGLGTGTVAAHGRPGDVIRFYEINPEVLRLSDKYFSYRKDSKASTDVTLGDARVSLERVRASGVSERFDVLVVDAFSSDAIPVHLLTRECFETFRFHMKPDGIVAFHTTNRFFDLSPVVRNLIIPGAGSQMQALLFTVPGNSLQATSRTDWILMTSNSRFLADQEVRARVTPWPDEVPRPIVWTDDYSNLVSVLYERGRD